MELAAKGLELLVKLSRSPRLVAQLPVVSSPFSLLSLFPPLVGQYLFLHLIRPRSEDRVRKGFSAVVGGSSY